MSLQELYNKHCTQGNKYSYGTSGFRMHNSLLDTVMFSTGIVVVLRSLYLKSQYVGVMITASHNPPQDNGVKIVEPHGEMLVPDWEPIATQLANAAATSFQEFESTLHSIAKKLDIDLATTQQANMAVARDSRESGPRLLAALKAGISVFANTNVVDFGVLTTPQLHFLTHTLNSEDPSSVEESQYYSFFLSKWDQLTELYQLESLPFHLTIDCANGVGAEKAQRLIQLAKPLLQKSLSTTNGQTDKPELLNESCGADFVKTNQFFPANCTPEPGQLYCSFDGDADRVVFYYIDSSAEGKFHLLDGDKIAILLAKLLAKLLQDSKLTDALTVGVVQTAYANGSSTKYIQETLQIPVSCTKTGVKHLHHEAVSKYDIGIYFEANGHGTAVFSPKFHSLVEESLAITEEKSESQLKALKSLQLFSQLINQTVGDAISDTLAVIAALCILKLTPEQWDSWYQDLPNRLTKAIVPDRSVFVSTNAERQLVSPEGLQAKIDALVAQYPQGRSFVRASGTEDAVRIYAEADTTEHAIELSSRVAELLK